MKFFSRGGVSISAKILVLLLGLAVTVTACVSGPSTVAGSEKGADGKPKWVTEGSATLKTRSGRLFHGVGVAGEKGSLSQQTIMADNRARAELARIVSAYFEISARNYIASGKADESQFTQRAVSRIIKDFTNLNVSDVQIADHWRDSESELVYSVAELNMQHIKESLSGMERMHKGFRHYLQAEADTIFDQIARRSE